MKDRLICKSFILISTLVVVNLHVSCGVLLRKCSFDVELSYVRSSCSLHNGFTISKISKVNEYDGDIPSSFEVDIEVSFRAISVEDLGRMMKKGLHKVSFSKEYTGYRWINRENYENTDTMPFGFEKNNWYLIDGLYENGAPTVMLFVRVQSDNSMKIYRKDSKTNF